MKTQTIHSKNALLYLLLASFFVFSKCNKEDALPEYYFRCKLDGQDYRPNICANCMRAQILGDTVFLMNGNADFQTVLIGVTQKPSFVLGNYILDSPSSGGAYKFSTTTDDRFDTDAAHTGKVEIISLDKSKKIISGTFHFNAYNPVQDKTVNITDGKFRLQYTDY